MAMVSAMAQPTTQVVYLSGTGADDRVDWEFHCSAGRNSGEWTTIPVPSCWEQEGFGGYYYGYGSGDRLYETGRYRHGFDVPAEWRGKSIRIVFEGVMTDAEVRVNGKLAGPVHQGAFYRFDHDITGLVDYGKRNKLEVLVKKHSDNKSVNQAERDADYWVFGGIFRPVYLEVKPRVHIQRVAVDARSDGSLRADVYIAQPDTVSRIAAVVRNSAGTEVGSWEQEAGGSVSRVESGISGIKPWSPEYPELYTLEFSLLDAAGNTLHRMQERIGFRTIEIRERDGIYVNGTRVKLKGVNRHTFHPKYGRTSSKSMSIQAANLIKDMNMNAVRMSHYPPDKHFLDVCDSLGLFVLDELAGWQHPPYDEDVGRKLLHEMIARDVNHPSIILWDNGNEGGWNTALDDDFGRLDIQQRHVLHPWQDFGAFNTYHYLDYNYLALDGYSRRKLFMPTEFLHGLYDGGHGAGLEDFWLRMWNEPLCAGGFLWVFADEAVERTDRDNQLDTYGNEAPDGILGPYHEREGSFFSIKEIWCPVHIEKRYITSAFNGVFNLENRFHYTDLKDCRFDAEWVSVSGPTERARETVQSSHELHIDLAPGQRGTLAVPLPDGWQNHDLLRITARDPHGRALHTWTWPLRDAAAQDASVAYSASAAAAAVTTARADRWEVTVRDVVFAFSKHDGKLIGVSRGDESIPLTDGPVFVSGEKEIEKVKQVSERGTSIIEVTFKGGDRFTWTVGTDARLLLDVHYQPQRLSEFAGITFSYPEDGIVGMRWLGNGPYRVYKNRMKGPQFGLWEKDYNNTVTGESGWVYPEFKGYHANVHWARILGTSQPDFTVYVKSDDIFLRVLTPQEPHKPEKAKMEYPVGNLSFLHSINGIGDKFMEAHRFGPQSNPALFEAPRIAGGRLSLSLVFDFNL